MSHCGGKWNVEYEIRGTNLDNLYMVERGYTGVPLHSGCTFVKNAVCTSLPYGEYGRPLNWAVIDE